MKCHHIVGLLLSYGFGMVEYRPIVDLRVKDELGLMGIQTYC